ncbi:ClpXP protease specificity-enhancing factor [Beggiatoa leptomitoformis]|uniref:ClpXP protease specificity-enhancing factor n=2 Tax=Beggiatoa leptomitoformis TaxID=288004 RepID=A0A2N9YGY8_9GAMM|nr:ClpXP protease specificity-enhancing factor [Beggiatoa leptomitoformis]AUI69754.2 ClpXP protease specificity-enhancing factor [Beggiatoa leptomitoformis]
MMTSPRPYLVRAIYEWIIDNGFTPYLKVNANLEHVEVPREFVNEDGSIILNVSPSAVRDLELGNEWLSFNARFSGRALNVLVPITAVLGIYTKENGRGFFFNTEEFQNETPPDIPTPPSPSPTTKKASFLKVVK